MSSASLLPDKSQVTGCLAHGHYFKTLLCDLMDFWPSYCFGVEIDKDLQLHVSCRRAHSRRLRQARASAPSHSLAGLQLWGSLPSWESLRLGLYMATGSIVVWTRTRAIRWWSSEASRLRNSSPSESRAVRPALVSNAASCCELLLPVDLISIRKLLAFTWAVAHVTLILGAAARILGCAVFAYDCDSSLFEMTFAHFGVIFAGLAEIL